MSDRRTNAYRSGAISSEVELLFSCTRADGVEVRIPEKLDWAALLEAAEYHGLAPMLHSIVERAASSGVPVDVAGGCASAIGSRPGAT